MRSFVVTPPEPVVTWEEAASHLRIDGDTTEKALVEGFIAAATGHIDGPDGWLGRAIGRQTIETRFDNFDCGSLRLPFPPVIAVESVSYVDASTAVQVIEPARYELLGASLVPAIGMMWPAIRWQREAVRVRYVAGYGGEGGKRLPAPIRVAILMMVGDMYANRETSGSGTLTQIPMSTTVEALLGPYRMWA